MSETMSRERNKKLHNSVVHSTTGKKNTVFEAVHFVWERQTKNVKSLLCRVSFLCQRRHLRPDGKSLRIYLRYLNFSL